MFDAWFGLIGALLLQVPVSALLSLIMTPSVHNYVSLCVYFTSSRESESNCKLIFVLDMNSLLQLTGLSYSYSLCALCLSQLMQVTVVKQY